MTNFMNMDEKMLPQFSKFPLPVHITTEDTQPHQMCFDTMCYLRLVVHTRQYRDNRDTHTDASFKFTPRHPWRNGKRGTGVDIKKNSNIFPIFCIGKSLAGIRVNAWVSPILCVDM